MLFRILERDEFLGTRGANESLRILVPNRQMAIRGNFREPSGWLWGWCFHGTSACYRPSRLRTLVVLTVTDESATIANQRLRIEAVWAMGWGFHAYPYRFAFLATLRDLIS
jgi:hypothetical protein